MKRSLLTLTLILGFIGLNTSLFAQKDFEGKIEYKIEFNDLPAEMQGMEAMLPNSMTTYIKGSKSRVEQSGGMTGTNIILTDSKNSEVTMLLNMMGQKMAIVQTPEEIKQSQEASKKVKVEVLDETKSILGYKCKRAKVFTPESEVPFYMYFTEEIPNASAQFTEVPGMPMEYSIEEQGMKMKFIASNVVKEKVSSKLFEIPADYPKMTSLEVQEMFQDLGQ